MSEIYESKKYKSLKIPDRIQVQVSGINKPLPKTNSKPVSTLPDGMFYEIEYDSGPIPGTGKFVLKSQKIEKPEKDEIRELFDIMREIAREERLPDYSRFYDRRVQQDNAAIFYKQGMFMKDFEDDYSGNARFSQYYPYYQMMGYEQLRTYFTWRTQVRKGNVTDTSLSYAFLYIYELLGNIGVDNPADGLEKLMSFWKGFGVFNKSIDRYVLRWLKDYHIYYELPQSFKEFASKNNITDHYPKMAETLDDFEFFCAISKYDIRKSSFFTDETSKIITDCFSYVIKRVRSEFETAGINFDNTLFCPTKKITAWKPFKDALFYQWVKQPDRRVVLSENEIYICNNNEWTFSTVIINEKGRQFIGYIMKQTEAVLRNVMNYKYKITADTGMIDEETNHILTKAGLFIDKTVNCAVMEFHREATKTVVNVNITSLERIRQEALVTQEALTVEEQTDFAPEQSIFTDSPEPVPVSNIWVSLKEALDDNELGALKVILQRGDIKAFADECDIMTEVLVDGINEKAADYIGDNIVDEEFVLYDDYIEQVKELIG